MILSVLLAYLSVIVTAALAIFIISRTPENTLSRIFATGMFLLSLEAIFCAMAMQSQQVMNFLYWYRLKTIAASLLPGTWLLFCLIYGRSNYREILERWTAVVIIVFLIPLILAVFLWQGWYAGQPFIVENTVWYLDLGWAGYLWFLAFIAGAILILMNLEKTLRHSMGRKRWQIKFMIIGIGTLFSVRIYDGSLAVLFHRVGVDSGALGAFTLLVATALMAVSAQRDRDMKIDIYMSNTVVYNSLTIVLVGIYFTCVGLLAWLARIWIGGQSLPLMTFFLFTAIIGLGAVLLSGAVRLKRKQVVSHLFERPIYDYRQVWSRFTQATSTLSNAKDLCNTVVRMISETLECLSVSIWIVEEGRETLVCIASTALPSEKAKNSRLAGKEGSELIQALWDQEMPVDFDSTTPEWVSEFRERHQEALKEAFIRYAVSLRAASRFVGVLTIDGRHKNEPLTTQDQELLKTIADQVASSLLNLRLAEQLQKAKALEALQMMSAFFMHDLKNLGSKLSLVTQNLPLHFDNPEFRKDALSSVTQSVEKINKMCSRLSLLSERLEVHPQKASLNRLVTDTLKNLEGMLKVPVYCSFGEVTDLYLDSDQMQKVLGNLLLNANDAVSDQGEIVVTTSRGGGWAMVAIRDNGCGIPREFLEKRLFKPFETTKQKGMGIGLFHCKAIVEAHGGRIEVESGEGKGTTFSVLLPENKGEG